jgi:hypothetical protein
MNIALDFATVFASEGYTFAHQLPVDFQFAASEAQTILGAVVVNFLRLAIPAIATVSHGASSFDARAAVFSPVVCAGDGSDSQRKTASGTK